MVDDYCIRNRLDTHEVLSRWELGRVLQLLHVDAMKRRDDLEWTWYPEPPAEMMAKIESTFAKEPAEWAEVEPDFS